MSNNGSKLIVIKLYLGRTLIGILGGETSMAVIFKKM